VGAPLRDPAAMCTFKVKFRSIQHAKQCMRRKKHMEGRMHAYNCPICHFVHVGHHDGKWVGAYTEGKGWSA
jgi:hypothetical protein